MLVPNKQSDLSNIIRTAQVIMVTTESEKQFHKQKAVDALERMKNAVGNEDLKDANRQYATADHHLGEMARLLYYEEHES